ncbi:FISUMP domain-containing protein [Fibrobacter sp. UWH1]|uniref:FISUMP domain-containing protein n=1 Tax=Fibrobacter sp. UWH1 TaxID=1964354 RepID=UPI001595F8AD|nr:FISUMP domain-containing protein [Fibrobacter sp. UWH1]
MASFEYGIYTDTREPENIREYHYLTIYNKEHSDSLTVFAENLNIGKMIDGSENQSDNSKIERYCYDNDTLICHYYGGLYQWAEMMNLPFECNSKSCADSIKPNHQGICPKEWRLMTYDDLEFIKKSEYVIHNSRDDLRTSFGFNGYNTTGFSLVQTGMRLDPIGGGGFQSFSSSAYWFYPEEKIVDGYHVGKDGVVNNSSLTSNVSLKTNGLSVRCVKIQ